MYCWNYVTEPVYGAGTVYAVTRTFFRLENHGKSPEPKQVSDLFHVRIHISMSTCEAILLKPCRGGNHQIKGACLINLEKGGIG